MFQKLLNFTYLLMILTFSIVLATLRSCRVLANKELALNIDKANFTIFHSAGKLIPFTPIISINKKPLTCDNSIKYLSIILDPLVS